LKQKYKYPITALYYLWPPVMTDIPKLVQEIPQGPVLLHYSEKPVQGTQVTILWKK
jgi:hypothetical protein